MKIREAIKTLRAQINFSTSPCSRIFTERGRDAIWSAIKDDKNWDQDLVKCQNCCIIQSSLLVPQGCPNCGSKDLVENITNDDIL